MSKVNKYKIPKLAVEAFVHRDIGEDSDGKPVGVWVTDVCDIDGKCIDTLVFRSKREAWDLACKVNKEDYIEGDF